MNLLVIGIIVCWAGLGIRKLKEPLKIVNGLLLYGIVLAIILGSIGIFYIKVLDRTELNFMRIASVSWRMIYNSGAAYLIILGAYSIGSTISRYTGRFFESKDQLLIDLAVGIMGLVFVLFFLGAFSLLKWWTVAPILLGFLLFNYKDSLGFLKATLIQPIHVSKDINLVGLIGFYMILVTISLNFAQNITPFPRGYDALSFYVNIPSLISDHSGLIEGYSPHNWSLFMSLGLVLFGEIETVLILSFIGGILSLFALFRLGRYWLNLDINYLMLGMAMLYITPTIVHQSSKEQKIDLGLLFISLVIILIFAYWIKNRFSAQGEEVEQTAKNPMLDPYIVLMGLLSGFAFGTKFTTLFLFFGIISGIWFAYNGKLGYLGITLVSLFAILLARVDDMSGLRQYHLFADSLKWILLVAGLGLLAFAFVKNRQKMLQSIKLSIIYVCCFTLPFLPWVSKNYLETKQFTVDALLNGNNRLGPDLNLRDMHQNYQQWKKDKNQ